MRDQSTECYASEREVFDALYSGRQKFPVSVLYELARNRGIFYSSQDERENLVKNLSQMTHDFGWVTDLIRRREQSKRADRTTSITLNVELSAHDIKEVLDDYAKDSMKTELVVPRIENKSKVIVNVEYAEIDRSRTRLIQRQNKEAEIEFEVKDGVTTVRMPATDKAAAIVQKVTNQLGSKLKQEIIPSEITLNHIHDSGKRTEFFTSIIRDLPDYRFRTVKSVKVASTSSEEFDQEGDLDLEDEANEEMRQQLIAYVNNVTLNGENVVASTQYEQLRNQGFFITFIKWQGEQLSEPYHLVQFEAGFENGRECKGFKYYARYAPRKIKGSHAKDFRPLREEDKGGIFQLIEFAARRALNEIDVNPIPEEG